MAIMIYTSAIPPPEMNIFEPFNTHSSPSSTALVRVPAASVPAFGSVSPKAQASFPTGGQAGIFSSVLLCRMYIWASSTGRCGSGLLLRGRRLSWRDFFYGHDVCHVVCSRSSVFRRKRHAHKTKLCQLAYGLVGVYGFFFVDFACYGRYLFFLRIPSAFSFYHLLFS